MRDPSSWGEESISFPFESREGRISNTCNIDAIAKKALSFAKCLPGQILNAGKISNDGPLPHVQHKLDHNCNKILTDDRTQMLWLLDHGRLGR